MKCMGCGTEKDPAVHEPSPWAEEDGLVSRPLCSLFVVECQGSRGWRAAVVCHSCFHRLEVDMWISERRWERLSPLIPYGALPQVLGDEVDPETRWDPQSYIAELSPQTAGSGGLP